MTQTADLIEQAIAAARRKRLNERRKQVAKQMRSVKRVIGKSLYGALEIAYNEYTGHLQFTVRGRIFEIGGVFPGLGMQVSLRVDEDWDWVSDADALMLYIDDHTRKEQE